MKVLCVVGARPNFMKTAPVVRALTRLGHTALLVHTGQHFDATMSEVFFEELGMPRPWANLQVGSGTHAWQTGEIMQRFEPVLADVAPDCVMVAGDVNSTLACGLVAVKRGVGLVHLEAGLRSYDREMPEEINRVLVDHAADLLLTPSADADANLRREGIAGERVVCVGNTMIDSLRTHLPRAQALSAPLLQRLGLRPGGYAVLTLHRPANVDVPEMLAGLWGAMGRLASQLPVVFSVHPRTALRLKALPDIEAVTALPPLGYLEFLSLQQTARLVLTDSGGIQEETTALGVACLTLRDNTERPITVHQGTNQVVGRHPDTIVQKAQAVLAQASPSPRVPPMWDGHAAGRVVTALQAWRRAA